MGASIKCSSIRKSIILQTYYFAIFIGIVSLHFDFKTRKFACSKILHYYAILSNVFVIIMAPLIHVFYINESSFYADNLQMKLVNSININLRFLAVLMTVILRWRRECHMKKIIKRLIVLEQEYFERVSYPSKMIKLFDLLFFMKYLSLWLQSLSSIYVVYRFEASSSRWMWYILFFYIVTMLNILQGVIMHYYMCLLHIGSRFYILNHRLNEVFLTIKQIKGWKSVRSQYQMQKALAAEMNCITYIHCNLTNIVAELNESYKFQILTVLATQVFNNTVVGYYGVMVTSEFSKFNLSYYDLIVGGLSYFILVFDLYLVDVNCHTIQTSHDITASILKQFYEFSNLEESLMKSCDLLSLHLMHRKLFITISGLFKLNKHTSFVMFGFTIRQVLILVQNDIAIAIRIKSTAREVGILLKQVFETSFIDDFDDKSNNTYYE